MRKKLMIGLAVLPMLTAAACGSSSHGGQAGKSGSSGGAAASRTLTIGEVADLTGAGVPFSVPSSHGVQLALSQINSSHFMGNNVTLKLAAQDDQSTASQGVNEFNALQSQNVTAILSCSLTSVYSALVPIANSAHLPLISTEAAGNGVFKPGYTFLMSDAATPMENMGKRLVQQNQAQRVGAIIATDNASFGSMGNSLLAGIKAAGGNGTFVDKEGVTSKQTDFSTVLTNLKGQHLTALFLGVLPSQGGAILNLMQKMGGFDSVQPVGAIGFTAAVASIAPTEAVRTIFAQPWVATSDPKTQQFVSAYRSQFNTAPTAYSALGYEAMWLTATAIKQVMAANGGSVSGSALADALPQAAQDPAFIAHSIVPGFQLGRDGAPNYPGVVATYSSTGAIIPAK